MSDPIHTVIDHMALWLEVAGVVVILIGVVASTADFIRALIRRTGDAYERYRATLGHAILLGLELLVGADIISTVTAPLTLESVGLLGLLVLIRTFLSFSLETEIEGRWPWQSGDKRPAAGRQPKA